MTTRFLFTLGLFFVSAAQPDIVQSQQAMSNIDVLPVTADTSAHSAPPAPVREAAPPRALPSPPVISGMIQFWVTGGDEGLRNTYRIRRAEVKASGNATPTVSWVLMMDLGKALSATSSMAPGGGVQTAISQSGRPLQDVIISTQVNPVLRIDAGQQKIPFGLEGAQSSSTLETVERALFASDRARGGSYGDVRDIGITARGRWTNALDYQVGAFNGSGEAMNDVDANQAKAMIGRVAIHPLPAVQLGISGVYAGSTAADAPRRDRDGVDLRIRSGRVLIQAEAVSGHDALIGRQGMYALAGYRILSTTDVHLRFDAWDPDVQRESDAVSATQRDYLAGVTWTLPGAGVKAQADIARRTWSAGITPSRWQLLINLQTCW